MPGELPDISVLVAEDNPVNQRVVEKMLGRIGINVDMASTGLEAVAMSERRFYHIILMDMMMPELDGVDATNRIRESENGDLPYIIALTANAMTEDRTRCLEAGMDDFMTKPFSMDTLHRKIHAAVEEIGRLPAAEDTPGDEGEIKRDVSCIDRSTFDTFKSALGDDADAFISELIRDYLGDANRARTAIHEGLDTKDSAQIRRHAHILKANSSVFGANRLADICNRIELAADAGRFDDINRLAARFEGELNGVCSDIRALSPEPVPMVA